MDVDHGALTVGSDAGASGADYHREPDALNQTPSTKHAEPRALVFRGHAPILDDIEACGD